MNHFLFCFFLFPSRVKLSLPQRMSFLAFRVVISSPCWAGAGGRKEASSSVGAQPLCTVPSRAFPALFSGKRIIAFLRLIPPSLIYVKTNKSMGL